MFDRPQWILASISIALVLHLSPPVVAEVPVAKVDRTAQTNSSDAADRIFQEGLELYFQGTGESLRKAIVLFEQALKMCRESGQRGKEASVLNNIGKAYSDLGEQQKALDYYNQSLSLKRAIGDVSGIAITLNNIGVLYSDLGEKQKALEYYQQALALKQTTDDRSQEAATLNNIGRIYDDLGEKQKALEYYHRSLPLSRAGGDRRGESATLNNIGRIYQDIGEKQQALKYFNQSLPLTRAIGDRRGEAIVLNNIGGIYSILGKKQIALEYYSQSLPLSRAAGDRSQEALTLNNIALLKRDLNNLPAAIEDIEAAIEIIENLRTKIVNPELRTSYFSTVDNYYKLYIDLLMQLHKKQPSLGYDRQALAASESSRARSLIELLQEANANISEGIDPSLLQQKQQLQQQIDNIERQHIQLISLPEPNQHLIDKIDKQRLQLLEKYQQLQIQIRTASPRYAAIAQPKPLTLSEIQQQILDENTILLQYSLGNDRSYLWVISQDRLTSYELPKREEIETAARKFRDSITNHQLRNLPKKIAETSTALSQLILQPAATELGQKRLLIVPDGVLHYIPFAALSLTNPSEPNAKNFLIARHEIIILPSASTLAIIRKNYADRKPPDRTLAILADPVFSQNDERVKNRLTPGPPQGFRLRNLASINLASTNLASNNLALSRSIRTSNLVWPPKRLPFTRQEAQTILSLLPSVNNSQLFDFAANRTTATDGSLANYQIVHFATHGIANSQNPELSGILMSMVDETGNILNGFLRLNDIFNLKLAADLVVLSACQTGLGENIQGEGMVGLTRGFMYAGAQRVAVSLWNVDDEGTSVLMQKFYQKMLQEKLAPAAALRAAQVEMMQHEKWNSPYYWAAFMIQGEWK
ncbi:MAG: CHAT domain-containing protein [Microcoleus sp.]